MKSDSRVKTRRHHSCNVASVGPEGREFRQFAAAGNEISLVHRLVLKPGEPLPRKAVQKGWRDLGQPRLNVAWLPPEHVYLRVVHLPKCDPVELRSMVELQLEKLSPLPANQTVWTFQVLPHPAPETQTVVVTLAERAQVEAFLGQLEADGFLADRLDVPWLDLLLNHAHEHDGTWIFLAPRGGELLYLTVWWYTRTLQHVSLSRLPLDEQGPTRLAENLQRAAWAGEVEGWLTGRPAWHLVSPPELADTWQPKLAEALGCTIGLQPAPNVDAVALEAARRDMLGGTADNLLPREHAVRYRQQFVDRLWMRGLGAVFLLYLLGVLGYFGHVEVLKYRKQRIDREVVQIAGAFTNALRLKERVRIFEEQAALRYAALEAWRLSSELLPTELTLTRFDFKGDKDVYLEGTVPQEFQSKVTEYNSELRKASIDGVAFFDKGKVAPPKFVGVANSPNSRWDFRAGLRNAEEGAE